MNAYKKDMESCNRYEERICAKEGKNVPFVERREVHKFIEEQLKKRYIRPSKLP